MTVLKRLFKRRAEPKAPPLATSSGGIELSEVCMRLPDGSVAFDLEAFRRILGSGTRAEIGAAYELLWSLVRKVGAGEPFRNYDAIGGAFAAIALARGELGDADGSFGAWCDSAILYDRYSPGVQGLIDKATGHLPEGSLKVRMYRMLGPELPSQQRVDESMEFLDHTAKEIEDKGTKAIDNSEAIISYNGLTHDAIARCYHALVASVGEWGDHRRAQEIFLHLYSWNLYRHLSSSMRGQLEKSAQAILSPEQEQELRRLVSGMETVIQDWGGVPARHDP